MTAEIFSVGTELLLGQIIDTNANYLARQLSRLGIDAYHKTTVGDNLPRLAAALRASLARADLIVISGGLGPTQDDVTVAGVAQALEEELVFDEASAQAVRDTLGARHIAVLESHLRQAYRPRCGRHLPNRAGTAPGLIAEKGGKVIICLPGPPSELKPMFEESVVPYLRASPFCGGVIQSRVLRFVGLGESSLEERLKDLIGAQSNPTLAPLASHNEVRLRITAKAPDLPQAQNLIAPLEAEVRRRLAQYIAGADDAGIEVTVSRLLADSKATLALAESCTGGLIAHRLTNIPGASGILSAALVCYGNRAKVSLLGVKEETLRRHGAVSEEVARAMARGARRAGEADFGLAVTGIAGPSGATATKPVGLVYLALAGEGLEVCEQRQFAGPRERIKELSATAALDLLRRALEGRLPPMSKE